MTATRDITRRKRAAQTGQPLMVRLQPDLLAALDAWIAAAGNNLTRPEAIRSLMAIGLEKSEKGEG
ncbi:hypothetical protein [uncultured Sphingomonas sp.]|uniref:hypothetical protein n=1 Tax=uncultured Sphingomonas sp. TaxID=158754 RepID=UPI00374816F7